MLFLLFSFSLWAQSIVIQSDKISDIEFEQYILENPQYKPFSQSLDSISEKKEMKSQLLRLLKKAQYEFVNGSIEDAKSVFIQIQKIQHKANWNFNERKTIHYAILRLAQMEKKKHKQETLVREALHFDNTIKPDDNLFPPPLIALYFKMKNIEKSKIWPLPETALHFKKILINGKSQITTQSFIQSSPGVKRFSFISDKYEPIDIITDIKNLHDHKINPTPLAYGSCESPKFSKIIQNKSSLGYYGPKCLLPTTIQTFTGKNDFIQKSKPIQKLEKTMKSTNIWTWVGLTALTAIVTWKVLENQKQKHNPAPSIQPSNNHISNSGASN